MIGGTAMSDSLVQCQYCGKEKKVDFAHCLKTGWPKCCGYTMRLVKSPTDITTAMNEVFAPLDKVITYLNCSKGDA